MTERATTPNTDADRQIHATRSGSLPFVQLATAVVRDPSLSANARTVYAIIATFVSLDTREFPLYRTTISKLLGKSPDTVDRAVDELVAKGILTVVPQWAPNGRPAASRFILHDVEMGVPDRGTRTGADMGTVADTAGMGTRADIRNGAAIPGMGTGADMGMGAAKGMGTGAAGVWAPVRTITRVSTPEPEPEALLDRDAVEQNGTTPPSKAKARKTTTTDPAVTQARDIVGRYMDWWAVTKGGPIVNSSRMFNALVRNCVTPALKAGHPDEHIRSTLAACARAGHEWPSDQVWRRVLDGGTPHTNGTPRPPSAGYHDGVALARRLAAEEQATQPPAIGGPQ